MMFFLRWPAVLVLLAMVAASLAPALATTVSLLELPFDLSAVSPEVAAIAGQAAWLEVGLWYGAAAFFLVAAIRLIRRTQGFWTWLIGFGLYGGRWAVTQQDVTPQDAGGLIDRVRGLTVENFRLEALTADFTQPAAQVALLALPMVVGLLVFVIDGSDRAYWDRQSA